MAGAKPGRAPQYASEADYDEGALLFGSAAKLQWNRRPHSCSQYGVPERPRNTCRGHLQLTN